VFIRDYLNNTANEITQRELPSFSTKDEFLSWQKDERIKFHKILGIDKYLEQERPSLNVKKTGTLQRKTYRIEKLSYESLPGLYVTANLYIPDNITKPVPAIIYLCGHSPTQKIKYQAHPRKFAQLGFVTLIIDTIEYGEVHGMHHGTHSHGQFQWISKGYTPVAPEVWNAIRGIDLISEYKEVDENKIGITGHSGGGAISWWTACCDDRIKAIASSSGTGTISSHVSERTIDTHCDCIFPNNPYGQSLIEFYALVAPRPILIVSPDRDKNYTIESVRTVYKRLRQLYKNLGYEDKIELFEFHAHHSYSSSSRKAIFSWFLKHLKGENIQKESMIDIDKEDEEGERLLVYSGQTPANDESTNVQEWFIPSPKPISINSYEDLKLIRTGLINKLKEESFASFPNKKTSLHIETRQNYLERDRSWYYKFTFESEQGWRLPGELRGKSKLANSEIHSPVGVFLGSPRDHDGFRFQSIPIVQDLPPTWLQALIDTRGIGETAWGTDINWHVRRSLALTGRTIASLRVWDILRGIQALRSMPMVDENKIIIAAEKDMTVPALYAALLDGNIWGLVLKHPPATQNIVSYPNGSDNQIEIINSLRHIDLPQVAGLIWPTKLIFLGHRPESYHWAESIHKILGEPGGVWRTQGLADWKIR